MAVEHFQKRSTVVDPLDDVDAVNHGACGSVPFRDHQRIPSAQMVDRFLELRTVADALAAHLLSVDLVASLGAQGGDLTIEVLIGA